jgi:hypothetical protein
VTAPANGEVLVGSVDLAVSVPASLTDVTFLQRASAADPWQVVAKRTSGSCTISGDSGGPVYTVDSSGRAIAKGTLSGGGGGGTDNSGGLLDPCSLIFTDIGLANSAFPGTVAWY